AHRHLARVSHGPIIVVRLRRTCFHGHGKWKLEIAAPSENERARRGIAEDVSDPEGGARTHQRALVGARAADEHGVAPLAAPRERGVSGCQLIETDLRIPKGQTKAVVGRMAIEGIEARTREETHQRADAT